MSERISPWSPLPWTLIVEDDGCARRIEDARGSIVTANDGPCAVAPDMGDMRYIVAVANAPDLHAALVAAAERMRVMREALQALQEQLMHVTFGLADKERCAEVEERARSLLTDCTAENMAAEALKP